MADGGSGWDVGKIHGEPHDEWGEEGGLRAEERIIN